VSRPRFLAPLSALAAALAACASTGIVYDATAFRRRPQDATPVRVGRLPERPGDAAAPVAYVSGMMIDTDGLVRDPRRRRAIERRDPNHKPETALRYADGTPLDPAMIPYIVLPVLYDGAKTGDLAVIQYGARTVLAVVGDRGPEGVLGAASVAAAEALGIDADATTGGVASGVSYTVFPGTGQENIIGPNELLAWIHDRGWELYLRHFRSEDSQTK